MQIQVKRKKTNHSGAVSMLTLLFLAGIIMEMATVGLAVSYLSGEQGLGLKDANIALYAARSGVQDVMMRITRDKTYVPGTNPYTLQVNGGSASIQVTRTLPAASTIQYTIVATGSAGPKRIKITSTVLINDTNGLITGQSMVESGL